jgi:hypothetical protein
VVVNDIAADEVLGKALVSERRRLDRQVLEDPHHVSRRGFEIDIHPEESDVTRVPTREGVREEPLVERQDLGPS